MSLNFQRRLYKRFMRAIASILIFAFTVPAAFYSPADCDSTVVDWCHSSIYSDSTDDIIELADTLIGGQKFIRRGIVIEQSQEEVWMALTDTAEIKSFMPKLKRYDVIENYPDSQKVFCSGKPHWLLKTFSVILSVKLHPPEEISWERIEGDLKSLRGFWRLCQRKDGKTIAVYGIQCEPGCFVPQFLINRGLKKDLPGMLKGVRSRVAERAKNNVLSNKYKF
ncbi:MAG: hypothetical protein NTV06_05465 [candidate division Zixibacteria bacterium]|nr:hypothetical protein [candidate division Zixibacteria bacterium]